MRILVANEGIAEAGGVDTYLRAILGGLRGRGHSVGFLHYNRRADGGTWPERLADRTFGVLDAGLETALGDVETWRPEVCFSHNMQALEVDRGLLERWPVVKMMHGYFGTCIGGQKSFAWPRREPCDRRFGAACVAFYMPRGCGQRRVGKLWEQLRWARAQRELFGKYAAVVVASTHMRREFVRNGLAAAKVHALPLFNTTSDATVATEAEAAEPRILFLGRMTHLKGGDLLIRSAAQLASRVEGRVRLTMAGDGPQRGQWTRLAAELGVDASFPGWVDRDTCQRLLRDTSVLAVPSIWPEPFGLVGLEAAAGGVPAVAFDVGGIPEWLRDGDNGHLAPGHPPTAAGLADALVKALERGPHQAELRASARRTARSMSLAAYLDALEPLLAAASRASEPAGIPQTAPI